MAFEIGRVCVKLAGRDAGCQCVVIDVLDNGFVLVDGETRRRKINTRHLEPLAKTIDVAKGASHLVVCKALGVESHAGKAKKAGPKPVMQRKHGGKQVKKAPAAKPAAATAVKKAPAAKPAAATAVKKPAAAKPAAK
jgi:large subunit ribosomal protein L14e